MERNRAELVRDRSIANQQKLVDLLNPETKKPVKHTIPGGRYMLEDLDNDTLPLAVYNWLRRVSKFKAVMISLARDPHIMALSKEKIMDFPDGEEPIWYTHPRGRQFLADEIAKVLRTRKVVTIEADKTGIYVSRDTTNKFSPTRKASQDDVEALLEENPESTLGIGDLVPNEAWEPYVEFREVDRPQYGRINAPNI